MLRHFRDADSFASFTDNALKCYTDFKSVLLAFRSFYALETFSLKEIDRYLWQLGKINYPKKY
jgi:hypothetical protein